MPERLPPHSHCIQCDNPIQEGQDYCSDECRQARKVEREKSNRRQWIFVIIVIAALIVLGVLTYR
jgi:predicted nucleic acid-binding Zn ribbon protein